VGLTNCKAATSGRVCLQSRVYPGKRELHVYTAPDKSAVLTEQQTLEGGDVLPGFSLALKDFFAEPKP
jgi:hypothetical protein